MSGTRYYTTDNNNNSGNREDFTSLRIEPNSPDSTSSIIDFHDSQQQNDDMVLDDSTYDFFVEAGLDNPSELSMLGVDMEDIRQQRLIAARRQVQQQQQNFTAQNSDLTSPSLQEPNTTSLGKRIERKEEDTIFSLYKNMKGDHHSPSPVHTNNQNSSSSSSSYAYNTSSSSSIPSSSSSSSKRKFDGELSEHSKRIKSQPLVDLPFTDNEVQNTSDTKSKSIFSGGTDQKENIHPDSLRPNIETEVTEHHDDATSAPSLTDDSHSTKTNTDLDDEVFHDASESLLTEAGLDNDTSHASNTSNASNASNAFNASNDSNNSNDSNASNGLQIAKVEVGHSNDTCNDSNDLNNLPIIEDNEIQIDNGVSTGSNAAESSERPIIDLFDESIFYDTDDMPFDYDSDNLVTASGHRSANLQTTVEPVTTMEPEAVESPVATDGVHQTATGSASAHPPSDDDVPPIASNQPNHRNRSIPAPDVPIIEILDDDDDDDSVIIASSSSAYNNSDMRNQNPNSPMLVDLTEDNDDDAQDLIDLTDDNDNPFRRPYIPIDLTADLNAPLLYPTAVDLTTEDNVPAPTQPVHRAHRVLPVLPPQPARRYHIVDDSDDEGHLYDSDDDHIIYPTGYEDDTPDVTVQLLDQDGRYEYHGEEEGPVRPDPRRRRLAENDATRPNPDDDIEQDIINLLRHTVEDDLPAPEERIGTPDGLSITLMEHQKIGLQWMQKMEDSPNHRGGILADDMGLGKTIQAMSIIIANPCMDFTSVDHSTIRARDQLGPGELKVKATLIICPVSLIDQWKREIETKTSPPLMVLVNHGASRPSDPYEFALYDIVLTSYAVNATNFQENHRGPLSKIKFHRVILDEAHTIKNKKTRAAIGCCSLEATYRWCMTATPVQNKLDELYSLIRFLRIRPFCIWDEFRESITKPMKNRNTEKALRNARTLMKAVTLRRSKKALIDGRPILDLPERNVHMTHIDFTEDERAHYDFVNQKAQARFSRYMAAGTVMRNFKSVLSLLLRLRQACLHPSLTLKERTVADAEADQEEEARQMRLASQMSEDVVSRLLSDSAGLAEIQCPICMDIAENAQVIANCGHILCQECFDGYWNSNPGTHKRCPQCRGDLDNHRLVSIDNFLKHHAPEIYEESRAPLNAEETEQIAEVQQFVSSAKIDKMIQILEETDIETGGQDKTIVFSQFTALLDLVEKPLNERGIRFLRYDGSMNIKARAEAVNKFFRDPSITVLLVSTKCGSLGLNLTCANRVILLDVWWNPALENQAIDRVHRIGQTKNVEVHRIFINDTVEQRILELQSKKQEITDSVFGEGDGQSNERIGLQEMVYLFRGGPPPQQRNVPPTSNMPGPSTRP